MTVPVGAYPARLADARMAPPAGGLAVTVRLVQAGPTITEDDGTAQAVGPAAPLLASPL